MIEAEFKAAVCGPKKATIDIPTFSVTLEETMAKKSDTRNLIPLEAIESRIFVLRGHRVMLDRDLAELYGVETRALNQAVKRNADRFPDDFMFKLTLEEAKAVLALRSQFVTLKRGEHLKYAHTFSPVLKETATGSNIGYCVKSCPGQGAEIDSLTPLPGLCIPTPRFRTAGAVGYYLSPFGLGV
jgi:hypothetical protein